MDKSANYLSFTSISNTLSTSISNTPNHRRPKKNKMSATPSFFLAVSKTLPNVASRGLKTSSRSLAPNRSIQFRSETAEPCSRAPTVYSIIPSIEPDHECEIPTADVLSRLSIFGLRGDDPATKQADYQLSGHFVHRTKDAGGEQVFTVLPKESDGSTITSFEVGESIWVVESSPKFPDQEHMRPRKEVEDHCSESSGQISDGYSGDLNTSCSTGHGGSGGGSGDVGGSGHGA